MSGQRAPTFHVPPAKPIDVAVWSEPSLVAEGLRQVVSSLPGFRCVSGDDALDPPEELRLAWTADPAEAAVQWPSPAHARGVAVVWIAPAWTPDQARAALEAGARGCLSASITVEEFAAALRQAARGDIALSPDVAGPLVALLSATPGSADRRDVPLSPREREVLTLVSEGLSNKAIAQRLYLSLRTVENHLAAVFAKLGVSSRTEAAVLAIRNGLVADGDPAPPPALERVIARAPDRPLPRTSRGGFHSLGAE